MIIIFPYLAQYTSLSAFFPCAALLLFWMYIIPLTYYPLLTNNTHKCFHCLPLSSLCLLWFIAHLWGSLYPFEFISYFGYWYTLFGYIVFLWYILHPFEFYNYFDMHWIPLTYFLAIYYTSLYTFHLTILVTVC